MKRINRSSLFMAVFLTTALVAGCGKDSSTDSGIDSGATETLSTKDCGFGKSCEGSYSTLSSDSKVWGGVCAVNQIDSGEWTYLWFEEGANCGFTWVRAQGSVGSDWAVLASGNATEFMIEHTGEDVFQLRLCTNGVNAGNERCL